jgi:hypothetical protein
MPKRGSCGSALPGCRLSKQYPSINSLDFRRRHACRDAHCTIFGSPACRHCTSPRARLALTIESGAGIESSSRPLLGRCPTSRDFVPWRFLDAGPLSVRNVSLLPASKNQHSKRLMRRSNHQLIQSPDPWQNDLKFRPRARRTVQIDPTAQTVRHDVVEDM